MSAFGTVINGSKFRVGDRIIWNTGAEYHQTGSMVRYDTDTDGRGRWWMLWDREGREVFTYHPADISFENPDQALVEYDLMPID